MKPAEDKIIIETSRLNLRPYVQNDVPNLLKIFSDPIAMENFTDVMDAAETQSWIDWNVQSYEDNGFGLYSVCLKSSGEFVGYCGFILQKDIDGKDEIEISYGFVREHWKKGYALEAAFACKQWGFLNLNTKRFISLIHPKNINSQRLAKRNGMTLEKTVHCFGHDHLMFCVTADTGL